jgi:phage terminase large subunit GpA-like protein
VWSGLDALLARTWTRTGGSSLPIHKLAIDSGYNTQAVQLGAAASMSRVIATKGVSTAHARRGSECGRRERPRQTMARGYKVWPVGIDVAKAEFYGWLRLERPTKAGGRSRRILSLPAHEDEFSKESARTYPRREAHGVRALQWQVIGAENQWLDCRVYARRRGAVGTRSARGVDAGARRAAAAVPVAAPSI